RYRRECPQTDRRDARPTHPAGGPDLTACGAGGHQPGDRRAAVHQPEHRRVPPEEGVPQARREVPHATCPARAATVRVPYRGGWISSRIVPSVSVRFSNLNRWAELIRYPDSGHGRCSSIRTCSRHTRGFSLTDPSSEALTGGGSGSA